MLTPGPRSSSLANTTTLVKSRYVGALWLIPTTLSSSGLAARCPHLWLDLAEFIEREPS